MPICFPPTCATWRAVTVWCSNDYLGMGQHPDVLDAMHEALDRCGAGCRRHAQHLRHQPLPRLLERELADLHGKEAALLFTSGYVSNWASLSTLGAGIPGCVVFSDAGNHASMIEGIRHSRAENGIFKHNDPEPISTASCASIDPSRPKLIAFESVYSMDGDIAPIAEICDVAEAYGAMTYLDEVHAVGLYGPARRRHCRARRPDATASPSSRARWARRSAWSAATSPLRPRSATSCAASPPASSSRRRCRRQCGRRRGLDPPPQEKQHRARCGPAGAGRKVLRRARRRGMPHLRNDSHIVPVMVGDAVQVQVDQRQAARPVRHLRAADQLPDGAARHRAAAHHADAQRGRRCTEIWASLGLRQAADISAWPSRATFAATATTSSR
jgi:5-aminolevulinate synthase